MKITLNNFKSLISGLSPDEMIKIIPNHFIYDTIIAVLLFKEKEKKIVIEKHLLRLLKNNYLSDYQLITLHNEEEKQVNNG